MKCCMQYIETLKGLLVFTKLNKYKKKKHTKKTTTNNPKTTATKKSTRKHTAY